ncbi:MAG TPA: hypothetical protein VIC28_18325 [Thermoanaerobaculia bacterium]|jgi:hypothetical protein
MEADGRTQKKPTSPWVYIGCGCGLAVLLALAGLAGLTYWGYQKGQEFERNFKDPKARTEKTREVVPYRELPAGYYPVGAFSIPLLMDVAIFSDEEPQPGETPERRRDASFNERGFIFMNMLHLRANKEKMERYLRGEAPAPEDAPWMRSGASFDPKEIIRRGTLSAGGRQVLYSAWRSETSHRGHAGKEGIVTMVMPGCADNRMRFGLWFGPDPAPEKPVAEVDFTGTNADPAAIAEFLSHFELCGGR